MHDCCGVKELELLQKDNKKLPVHSKQKSHWRLPCAHDKKKQRAFIKCCNDTDRLRSS